MYEGRLSKMNLIYIYVNKLITNFKMYDQLLILQKLRNNPMSNHEYVYKICFSNGIKKVTLNE